MNRSRQVQTMLSSQPMISREPSFLTPQSPPPGNYNSYADNLQRFLEQSEANARQDDRGQRNSQLPDMFGMAKTLTSELQSESGEVQLTQQQIEQNIKYLQNMWCYRYARMIDHAIVNNDWFRLFSFLSQFKEKSIMLVKKLILSGLENSKEIDEIDHRYNMKNVGEDGIYLVDGIVIRLAKVKGDSSKNSFDQNAVKALHQEFLSINILNNLCISLVKDMPTLPRIRVPLTCIVKYGGYTALCQADSPCNGLQTLVHGPTGTIYQFRQQNIPLLQVIGRNLNLKSFSILSSDKKSVHIPFSLTVQLHKITLQANHQRLMRLVHPTSILYPPSSTPKLLKPQYYLMNISKLWPLFIDSDIIKSVGYLRPEVVISSRAPLSNAVFCEISERSDSQGELELADACKKVKEDYITSLARMLDKTTIFVVDSQGIEDIMHQYGINIRYLGALADKVTLQFNKNVLETEMVARICKRYFFRVFYDLLEAQKLSGDKFEDRLREYLIQFLNVLFIKNKQGQHFFRNYICVQMKRYYDYKLNQYPPDLQGGGLLHAIGYHFGIRFKIIDYPFFQNLPSIFNASHILDLHASSKTFDMDTTQIKQITFHYKLKRKQKRLDQCIKQLQIISTLHSLLNNQQTFYVAPLPQSYFYTELAQVYFSIGQFEQAYHYAQKSLKGIPEKHSDAIRPYRVLLKYHSQKKQISRCTEYYQKSQNYLRYHLGANHPLTIEVYNTLAIEIMQSNDPTKCQKMFLKSLQICQRSLGYTHATSSEILLQLAELPLSVDKKINYYLQGLAILENLQGTATTSQKSRQTCAKIAEMYYQMRQLQKMIYYAKKSGHWMMQIMGQSMLNNHKQVMHLVNRLPVDDQELMFLLRQGFNSYLQLIERTSKSNLYKLYVSIKDVLLEQEEAIARLFVRLSVQKVLCITVTEFLRSVIKPAIELVPQLIRKPKFYVHVLEELDPGDQKSKLIITSFVEIVSVVGPQLAQKALTEHPKLG